MSFEGEKRDKALSPMQQARIAFQSSLQDTIKELGKDKANEAWRKRMIAEQIAVHFGLIDPRADGAQVDQILTKIIQ